MGNGNFLEAEERQPEPEDQLDRATEPASSKYQNPNIHHYCICKSHQHLQWAKKRLALIARPYASLCSNIVFLYLTDTYHRRSPYCTLRLGTSIAINPGADHEAAAPCLFYAERALPPVVAKRTYDAVL